MRDDLHKSAPVRSAWKRWIRSCSRPAENGEVAEEQCRRAVIADCHADISPALLAELSRRASDPQSDMFGGKLAGISSSVHLGGTGSVLDEQLLTRARMEDSRNGLSSQALERVVASVLSDHVSANLRAAHGHVQREGGTGANECLREIKRSAAAISSTGLASDLLKGGGRIPMKRRGSAPVSLDENLLGRK